MEWYQVKNKKKKQQRADASSIINFINKTREQTSLHPMLKSVLKVYWKTEQLINHIMIKYHKKSKKKIIWLKILPKILICVLKIQMTPLFQILALVTPQDLWHLPTHKIMYPKQQIWKTSFVGKTLWQKCWSFL